jgi:hypothetical protein
MKWIFSIVCMAVAAFCVFGFMATFEPGVAGALAFRIGYAVLGIVSLAGFACPWVSRKAS